MICIPGLQVSNVLHSWIFLDGWVAETPLYMAHCLVPLESSSFILKLPLLYLRLQKDYVKSSSDLCSTLNAGGVGV